MIDRRLLERANDRNGLVDLLAEGLGRPVNLQFPFDGEPEIAVGVRAGSEVQVHSLVPESGEGGWLIILAEFKRPYVRKDLRDLLSSQ